MLRSLLLAALFAAPSVAQILTVDNPGVRPFTDWVQGTIFGGDAAAPVKAGAFTVVPGRVICDGLRTCWVRGDAGVPVGTTRIDLAAAKAVDPPVLSVPTPAELIDLCGVPTINGNALEFQSAQIDGPAITTHFRDRQGMFVFDLDLPFVPGRGWAPFVLSVTHSDVSKPTLFSDLPAPLLTWSVPGSFDRGSTLFWQPPQALRYGPDQSQRYVGAVYWPEVRDVDARANAAHMVWSPLTLWDGRHATQTPPFGALASLAPNFRAQPLWASLIGTMRSLQGTWSPSPLGPHLQAGSTGGSDGHENDGDECAAVDTARYVLLVVEAARLIGRRPDDRREASGEPLVLANHRWLKTWSNIPWAWAPQADLLGKVLRNGNDPGSAYPPNWEIPGNAFPADQQHFIMLTLAAGYRLSGDPSLQRTIHTNLCNLITRVRQDHSARAVGWTLHASSVLDRASNDQTMRMLLRATNDSYWQGIWTTCSRPATHPGWWHSVTNASRFGGNPYTPPWEHALAAGGLTAYWLTFNHELARQLAVQAGLFTVRHGWEEQGTQLISIDSLEIAADGVNFARKEVFNTYWTWMTWGACAVLRAGANDARVTAADRAKAQRIVQQTQASLQIDEWIF